MKSKKNLADMLRIQLYGYDLTEEHRNFIRQLGKYCEEYSPDAVLIAGDIYDRAVPSAGAVTLMDELLTTLSGITVLIISGNHDNAQRLNYGSDFLRKHNIYISSMPPVEDLKMEKISLSDENGNVNFYLLPFFKPVVFKNSMPDEYLNGENAIIKKIVQNTDIDKSERNVVMSHQFFISGHEEPKLCDSEQLPAIVGGLDAVDIAAFEDFEYSALGHIHGGQFVGNEKNRYSGTPVKFSVSERNHNKSIVMVDLEEKGKKAEITKLPLNQIRDVKKLEGYFEDIIALADEEIKKDYVSITLRDEDIIPNVKEKLNAYFDNILEVIIDNSQTRKIMLDDVEELKEMSPFDSFNTFFEQLNDRKMDENESELFREILSEVIKE